MLLLAYNFSSGLGFKCGEIDIEDHTRHQNAQWGFAYYAHKELKKKHLPGICYIHLPITSPKQADGITWCGQCLIPIQQSLTFVHYVTAVFQADEQCCSCYKGQIVMEWFEEHSSDFQVMSWPPNSCDINAIDHLLSNMENRWMTSWYHIAHTTYQYLELMPCWVLTVFRATGGPTCFILIGLS